MADITIRAAYASVVEDEGLLFIGFAEGEDDDEPYLLFRQPLAGGPVWMEVTDEDFGAEDAVERIEAGPQGLRLTIRKACVPALGYAGQIAVRIGPDCEDAAPALAALRDMLAGVWVEAVV